MPETKYNLWYDKAEDYGSSAFTFLWRKNTIQHDAILVNNTNNRIVAYVNHPPETDEILAESLTEIDIYHPNITIQNIDDHYKTVLMPKALFNENEAEKLFSFNFTEPGSEIKYSELSDGQKVLLFADKCNAHNHISEGLLEMAQIAGEENTTIVYVSYTYFTIIQKQNNAITFFNSFDFQTSEDFIYYLLFSLEQLEFDTKNNKLTVFGFFETDSAIHKLIQQYFGNFELRQTLPPFSISQEIPMHLHHQIIPLATIRLCV